MSSAAQPAASPVPNEIKAIFDSLFSNIGQGVSKLAKADIQIASQSLQQTPTVTNLMSQGLLLQAKAVLQEPQAEALGVGQLGIALGKFADLLPG